MFEYEQIERRSVRYTAPAGFHDDCVDALALAVEASTSNAKRSGGRVFDIDPW